MPPTTDGCCVVVGQVDVSPGSAPRPAHTCLRQLLSCASSTKSGRMSTPALLNSSICWRLSGAVTCCLCPRIFPPRCVGWPARTQRASLASRAPARPWARQQGSGGGREGEPLRHTCGRPRGAAAAAGLAGTVGGGGSARRARRPARQRRLRRSRQRRPLAGWRWAAAGAAGGDPLRRHSYPESPHGTAALVERAECTGSAGHACGRCGGLGRPQASLGGQFYRNVATWGSLLPTRAGLKNTEC
jgi:hypothetical protein